MNTKQRKTLIIAGSILAVVFLFPPWKYVTVNSKYGRQELGPYRFILLGAPSIPVTRTAHEAKHTLGYDVFHDYMVWEWEARVDRTRLSFSIGAIVAIGLVSFLYNADKKN